MDDSRTDAPKFDLTARPSEDEDVLLAEPADLSSASAETTPQKKKPEIRPTPPNAEFDAKLFNALVSPVAPVHLTERSASAQQPAPVEPTETPAQPAAAPLDPVVIKVETTDERSVAADIEVTVFDSEPPSESAKAVDAVGENDAPDSSPIPMVQPVEISDVPSVHDWEPLPPMMRIAASESETGARGRASEPVPGVADQEPDHDVEQTIAEQQPASHATTWDPAAADDPPAMIAAPLILEDLPASDEEHDLSDDPSDGRVSPTQDVTDVPMPDPEPLLAASPEDLGPVPEHDRPTSSPAKPTRTGAWWTLPMMCLGLAIVACAVLVPAADENRRDLHELAKLEQDVAYFQKQSEVNQQFLEHVSTDPTLAERLAQRQLRMTRVDSRVVQMSKDRGPFSMSPYALVTIDPPAQLPEYRPMGGFLSRYFLDTKGQIYLTGLGILMVAAGVILGGGEPRKNA